MIAVTGSVGKTSTKEMLATVLSHFGKTHAAKESFNNHIGVPITLANMPYDTEYGVFEIGMNRKGEISPLVSMVRPHIAIITRVGAAHFEAFNTIEEIAAEKATIMNGLSAGGFVIINHDDTTYDQVKAYADEKHCKVLTFGEHEDSDARLLDYSIEDSITAVQANILGQVVNYKIAAEGKHFALNSLAVLLACHKAGINIQEAALQLENFKAVTGRGQRHIVPLKEGSFTLLDESYNANPISMEAALHVLKSIQTTGRKIAVLGDMMELGSITAQAHHELVPKIIEAGIQKIYLIGKNMSGISDKLPEEMDVITAIDIHDIKNLISQSIQDKDILVIKGSNSSKLSILVQLFIKDAVQKSYLIEEDSVEDNQDIDREDDMQVDNSTDENVIIEGTEKQDNKE
jgi:UDP-N-acetylmuramoyl-tripeptide--D-alanyl-D-alanine ligase